MTKSEKLEKAEQFLDQQGYTGGQRQQMKKVIGLFLNVPDEEKESMIRGLELQLEARKSISKHQNSRRINS